MDLEKLSQGAVVNGDSGNSMTQLPEWMDKEKFNRGRSFFERHAAPIILALHCSLTTGFSIPRLLEALIFNRASDTPQKSLRRYLETFVHVVLWHVTDVWDCVTPSVGHRSLAFVRRVHGRVANAMNNNKSTRPTTSVLHVVVILLRDVDGELPVDAASSASRRRGCVTSDSTTNHISQYDLAVVQAGFFAAIVMYPQSFGVSCSRAELDDYVFFWRGIGYLLGICDEFNVCSSGLDAAYATCKAIEIDVVKGLEHPPAGFECMADAYINGQNLLSNGRTFSTKESVIAFSCGIMGHEAPSWLHLTWADYLRLAWLQLMAFLMHWCPGFEKLLNLGIMYSFKNALPMVYKQLSLYSDRVAEPDTELAH